ncbi:MAG TPA: head GIN domain-containing protein [Bacteroidales bacterium]|nr:head GIN domain-containing protein [Bacteroidales bacterium]
MRSLKIVLITLICMGTFNLAEAQVKKRINGSGDVKTETRNLEGFTGVKTATAVDIYLTQGNNFDVVVEADDNLLEYIVTEVKDDALNVYLDKVFITGKKTMIVHVTMPEIEFIKASSAGDVIGQTPIKADNLKVSTSSAGDVNIEVTAKTLYLSTSSSGDITISGEADYLEASTSSAGDIKGYELTVREADVSASSAGDVKITVTERLKARASSAGDIYYQGNPEYVDAKSSSAGDVVKR